MPKVPLEEVVEYVIGDVPENRSSIEDVARPPPPQFTPVEVRVPVAENCAQPEPSFGRVRRLKKPQYHGDVELPIVHMDDFGWMT